MKTLNELRDEAYATAKSKGFYETPPSFGERVMLIVTEAAEAMEYFREGLLPNQDVYDEKGKPVSIPSEFADIIIRVLDACGYYEIDIERAIAEKMAYNLKRPHKHGKTI